MVAGNSSETLVIILNIERRQKSENQNTKFHSYSSLKSDINQPFVVGISKRIRAVVPQSV
jgi:hypothetical protein